MFDLESAYETYHEQIYKFLYFLTFDEQLAEDLMQETFIRAQLARHTYRNQSSEITWLRTIAKNLAIDYFRRKKLVKFIPIRTGEQFGDVSISPETLLHIAEEERGLYEALAQLKFEYRASIVLRKIEGLSIKETAQVLGWNESKVKNNTERGMKKLAEYLKEGNRIG